MAIWICSGAVPERAASMIVLAGIVTRMPWRVVMSLSGMDAVAVCRVTPLGARTPRCSRETSRCTVFGRTSESPCSTSALSCETIALSIPTVSHAARISSCSPVG